MPPMRRQALFGAVALCATGRAEAAQAPAADDPWPSLAAQIFDDQPLADGAATLAIDLPYRAEDAAVRCSTHHPQSGLAANPKAHAGHRSESVTARGDVLAWCEQRNYRVVHARSGRFLHQRPRCRRDSRSAALRDRAVCEGGRRVFSARRQTGGRLNSARHYPLQAFPPREIHLLIRHPNYSGMQMDQLTRLYVAAHFVSSVRILQGDELSLGIDSGISISANPEFRFDYRPNGAAEFHAEVQDSHGQLFKQTWSAAPD